MSEQPDKGLSVEDVQGFFSEARAIQHYARATAQVGLWLSEEKIFREVFLPSDTLLDLGCGAGRVALGLYECGYEKIMGVDLSRGMVQEARQAARLLEYRVPFRVGDARSLEFGDNSFEGVIFSFNGLMQIPGAANRVQAVKEIARILVPGGHFVCTTHDREEARFRAMMQDQARRWAAGQQDVRLTEFGDNLFSSKEGTVFMHLPTREEVRQLLEEAGGLTVLFDAMRSEIANEPQEVRDFSDHCRFWIARKTGGDEPLGS